MTCPSLVVSSHRVMLNEDPERLSAPLRWHWGTRSHEEDDSTFTWGEFVEGLIRHIAH